MMFSQIKQATFGALQGFIESISLPVAVGKISDYDYSMLSRGYGNLNWDVAITSLASSDTCIDLVFKLLPDMQMVDAAVLGLYSVEDQSIELHYIESFIKRHENHPLRGRVMLLTIVFSYLLLCALDGKQVALIDPLVENIAYYELLGFKHVSLGDGAMMVATRESLDDIIGAMIEKLEQDS